MVGTSDGWQATARARRRLRVHVQSGFAAILDLGWIDGRRTRKWVYGKTERETLAKLSALKRRQEHGENLAAAPRTMGEWLADGCLQRSVRARVLLHCAAIGG